MMLMAAGAASALYLMSYLSFVYLLKYPRNWMRPSLRASLATGVLAGLTVAVVSLSADGVDWLSLIVLAGFIAILFFVISAPARAFRPASALVEYLAKHSDVAGLWLLGPALVAGIFIANPKLQAVLFTAMAVEAIWSARQRLFPAKGRLLALSDRDLPVLKSQAQGDLNGFKKRHNIRELVLGEAGVQWQGCEKSQAPCPFNLYVNRLGLNTAPCCREHMRDLSHYVAGCLSDMGAVHWLEGGSLLGAIRENGRLLDWEDDVDISVLVGSEMTREKLTDGLAERCTKDGYYLDVFPQIGLITISSDRPGPWLFRWQRNRMRGEIRADIAIYHQVKTDLGTVLERCTPKGAMPATGHGGYGVPREMVVPTKTVPFLGRNIASPNQPEAYLKLLYGDYDTVEYTYVDPSAAKVRAEINQRDAATADT